MREEYEGVEESVEIEEGGTVVTIFDRLRGVINGWRDDKEEEEEEEEEVESVERSNGEGRGSENVLISRAAKMSEDGVDGSEGIGEREEEGEEESGEGEGGERVGIVNFGIMIEV